MDPVLLLTGFVRSINKRKFGTIYDPGSTDHFILSEIGEKMRYKSTPCTLLVDGIAGAKVEKKTALYQVPIIDKFGEHHIAMAYGLDKILKGKVVEHL